MRLFSPWALWFLAFIPVIILMYILKQKFEEREISSIYLWHQVLKDIEVNTPWQKLKKNLLLFMQLLFVLLLIFALSNPLLFMRGGFYSNIIIVIDNTGSMNTSYASGTRLEEAKKLAENLVRNSGENAQITIISSGRYPKVELTKTVGRSEALSRIKAIKPSNAAGNVNDSVSMVKALAKQYDGNYKAVFYTDSSIDTKGINAELVSLWGSVENASLDYISHARRTEGLRAMVRVTNRSGSPLTREISLYGGDELLDLASVELKVGETRTVYFEKLPTDIDYIWAELTEKDGLMEDNVIYDVVRTSETQRVLLVSDQNIFVEKAIAPISNIELYKTNPGEKLNDDYDLYIYDGSFPTELPKSGNIMLINPPSGNSLIVTGSDIEGGIAKIEVHPVTKYMDNANFTIAKLKSVEAPYWADTLIRVDSKPAVMAGEYKGRRIGIMAFDLHNSDFTLTPEYPIFMHNMMAYLLDIGSGGKASYQCGEPVDINPSPDAKAAYIQAPSKGTHSISLKYPILPFEETGESGIYKLVQKIESKEKASYIAVNFPVESESGAVQKAVDSNAQAAQPKGAPSGTRVQGLVLILVLILAAVEWVVYIRGY